MRNLSHRLCSIHRFLVRYSLYPLVLSSLLAIALLAGRIYRSRSITYAFLVWNLLLAWIPYLSSLWTDHVHRRHSRWWCLLAPGALWLVFFPNAPYIITDFLHLQKRAPIPLWYDIGLLSAFAWTGLFLAVVSLRTMQRLVKHYTGSILGWVFVAAVTGLSGLGIYMGRFLRWNSWDLFLHPRSVLGDVAARLAHPWDNPRAFGVTFLFAAILLVCYLTMTTSREPAGEQVR
jgi:uncharacterized membrane protein